MLEQLQQALRDADEREFGLCVFHALACDGKLDNEGQP